MGIKEILEYLKNHLDKQKQIRIEEKARLLREEEINQAFANLDIETLIRLINGGSLIIKNYEQQYGSTFIKALLGFSSKMLDDLKNLDNKNYFNYYFGEFKTQEKDDLPPNVKAILNGNTERLMQIMQLLYQNGARISYSKPEDMDSIFSLFVNELEFLKTYEIFGFFFDKPEFQLSINDSANKDLLSSLVRDDSNLSTAILEQLLNMGLKVESTSSLNAQAQSIVPTDPDLINPILECLAFSDKTKKAKLDLIYPLAPSHLQARYKNAYEDIKKGKTI